MQIFFSWQLLHQISPTQHHYQSLHTFITVVLKLLMYFNKGMCKVVFVAEPQRALHNGSQNWHPIEFATGPPPIYNNCLPVPKPPPCLPITLSLHIYHSYWKFAPFTGTQPSTFHGEAINQSWQLSQIACRSTTTALHGNFRFSSACQRRPTALHYQPIYYTKDPFSRGQVQNSSMEGAWSIPIASFKIASTGYLSQCPHLLLSFYSPPPLITIGTHPTIP